MGQLYFQTKQLLGEEVFLRLCYNDALLKLALADAPGAYEGETPFSQRKIVRLACSH